MRSGVFIGVLLMMTASASLFAEGVKVVPPPSVTGLSVSAGTTFVNHYGYVFGCIVPALDAIK